MTLMREQIAGLRDLLAKATPKWDAPGAARHGCDFWRIGDDAPYTAITKREADARLIHAAVNALPALLDELDALRALRARVEAAPVGMVAIDTSASDRATYLYFNGAGDVPVGKRVRLLAVDVGEVGNG